jgi:hypothetical protein
MSKTSVGQMNKLRMETSLKDRRFRLGSPSGAVSTCGLA